MIWCWSSVSTFWLLRGIQIYHGNQCCHTVWMGSNENCGRNSTLKFPAAFGPVLRKKSKCHKFPFALRSIIRFALQSAVSRYSTFQADSNVKISKKCHKFCKTGPITKKSNSLHFPMVSNVLIKFAWDLMKIVGDLKIVESEIVHSALNVPELNSMNRASKYPTYVRSRAPKCSSVSRYGQPFSRYSTFQAFPLTSC